MNDTGPHLGKSKQNQEISEFKILVGTNVLHVQTVWIIISMHGRSLGSNITEARGLGREAPPSNHVTNDMLSKENTFFLF